MTQWLRFVNLGGFPTMQSTGVNTSGTVTTISFSSHPFRLVNRFQGGFWIKIPTALTGTATNTILFDTLGVADSIVPVYLNTGALATLADFTSTSLLIHLCFYDRESNIVLLIA